MTVIQETVIYADPVKLGVNAAPATVIAIKIGESGYYPIYGKFSADELNTEDVTPEIVESAVAGSMFGWDCPAAKAALDPRDESGCPLSPPEMQKLRELEGKMIAFRVTITLPDRVETINVLAANAVSANVLVVDQLFGDCFDTDKMQSFKIKVEPLKRAA